MTQTINAPRLSGDSIIYHYRQALRISEKVADMDLSEGVLIDLSRAEWFTPMFLAPVSVLYNAIEDAGFEISIKYPGSSFHRTYLNQIEFPSGTTDPEKEYPNHLPLFILNNNKEEDAIEVVGQRIRDILSKNFSDLPTGSITGIHYPIDEVIDNVDYHSKCDHGSLLVQNYPNKPFLDICIADNGVSIPGNFEDFGISFDTDKDAVRMALTESISTKPDFGHERGYGLRTTSKMICQGLDGTVLLSSRNATMLKSNGGDAQSRLQRFSWPGTVFAARLYPPRDTFDWHKYVE